MRHFAWALTVGLALLAVMPCAQRARAQTEESADDAARRHFRLGQAHYENGEFAEAATEFEEAYRLSQRSQLLYNIYVSYRDAGDMPHAAHALHTYLDLVPDADNAAQLRARLTAMERVLATQATTTTSATPTETTSTQAETTATVGEPSAESTAPIETTPDTTPAPEASSGGGFGSSPVGWIVGGVGAAAIIAGIVTGVMALDSQNQLDAMCGPDHHSCPAGFESTRDTGAALGAATDGLLIGGIVALGSGIALLFILTDGGAEQPPVTASCGPTGCSATLSGRF